MRKTNTIESMENLLLRAVLRLWLLEHNSYDNAYYTPAPSH